MIKAVIIDDEYKTRDLVESILQNNFPEIKITGKADSVLNGVEFIQKNKPDIVFLDIEMQDGNGFDLLDAIPEKEFDFIFITAYNQYAIKAFRYSAVDYILKPINVDHLNSAVSKLITNHSARSKSFERFSVLKENMKLSTPSKMAIPSSIGYDFVQIKDIIRFEADGRYSQIHLLNEQKIMISKSLGELSDFINESFFYRPHKSHIINLKYVKRFYTKKEGIILMADNSEIPISRDKRPRFLKAMKMLSD